MGKRIAVVSRRLASISIQEIKGTMNRLEQALALAAKGFHIFPCEANGKLPVIKDFPNRATRDPEQIRKWFENTDRNIGISTTRFGDDQALVVVDIDNKDGKDGDAQLFSLELEGYELPASLEQSTPSGGRHIIYAAHHACKQGVNVLGDGLDIRSRGGYIVGPGSTINGKSYSQINGHDQVAIAPTWLVARLGIDLPRPPSDNTPLAGVDADRAALRAMEYLKTAPVANEGEAGDLTTFKVAAKLKDVGCTEAQAFEILSNHWNDNCQPPWELSDLQAKVRHAFTYGREQPGISAPEAVFTPVVKGKGDASGEGKGSPKEEMNKEFAFVKTGAFVLQETTDHKGNFTTQHLGMAEFHGWFANVLVPNGKNQTPLSQQWMTWAGRRQYEGVVFAPEKDMGPRWYNLWRGFTVEPAESGDHPAVKQFLDHALNNICAGDEKLCQWLIGYFAHIIQRPWEKPLVALVFRGAKGVGKNALVERVGKLLGPHFLVADDERYLLSNFNSHLEANLFFVLDEASWAGDKRAEGKLKGLITGAQHMVERKGKEPYRVDNLTRVAIIGNEKWLVPATQDERRFAVFNVGAGRKQDQEFFKSMREGLERGGYCYLLRYLKDFDLSKVDVNTAPNTQGLIDQKHASLDTVQEWWLDCLSANALVGSDWDGVLPEYIPTNRMRTAFEHWAKGRNIRSRLPGRNDFLRTLHEMTPSMVKVKARPDDPQDSTYSYKNPGLEGLRSDWDRYIGGTHDWDQ